MTEAEVVQKASNHDKSSHPAIYQWSGSMPRNHVEARSEDSTMR